MKKRNLLRFISVFVLTFMLACSGIISPDSGIMNVSTVKVSAAKAKISKKKKTVGVGTTFKLKIKNAKKKYTWTSSDPSVAKVKTKKGKSTKIVAVSAGKATITATLDGTTFKCVVTVKAADTKPTATPKPTAVPTPTPIPTCDITTDNADPRLRLHSARGRSVKAQAPRKRRIQILCGRFEKAVPQRNEGRTRNCFEGLLGSGCSKG